MLIASGVTTMIDANEGFTPTPLISHAILGYNRSRTRGLADGIVITPSHNPPRDGGLKYSAPHGGPADAATTGSIERTANDLLTSRLASLRPIPYERARAAAELHRHNYVTAYVADFASVLEMSAIAAAGVSIGIDPLGGAAVKFWEPIIDRYGLNARIVSDVVDPTCAFMTVDWDGQIRMDCSSPYAMMRLVGLRGDFDVAFGNDTYANRHGIVTRSQGLMNPNQYLAAAASYLLSACSGSPKSSAIGKTMVISAMLDRVAVRHGRALVEPRSASAGSLTACWTARSVSQERKAPALPCCAATARCGRPTRTASCSDCWRPRSSPERVAIPANSIATWQLSWGNRSTNASAPAPPRNRRRC